MIDLPANRIVTWDEPVIDLDWAQSKKETKDATAIVIQEDEWHHLDPFIEFLESLFDFKIHVWTRYVGIWDERSISTRDQNYAAGFPHRHNNDLCALSVVVQEPIKGGEATLILDNKLLEVPPQVGRGILIGGRDMHGVKRVFGLRPRIALIAQFHDQKEP